MFYCEKNVPDGMCFPSGTKNMKKRELYLLSVKRLELFMIRLLLCLAAVGLRGLFAAARDLVEYVIGLVQILSGFILACRPGALVRNRRGAAYESDKIVYNVVHGLGLGV